MLLPQVSPGTQPAPCPTSVLRASVSSKPHRARAGADDDDDLTPEDPKERRKFIAKVYCVMLMQTIIDIICIIFTIFEKNTRIFLNDSSLGCDLLIVFVVIFSVLSITLKVGTSCPNRVMDKIVVCLLVSLEGVLCTWVFPLSHPMALGVGFTVALVVFVVVTLAAILAPVDLTRGWWTGFALIASYFAALALLVLLFGRSSLRVEHKVGLWVVCIVGACVFLAVKTQQMLGGRKVPYFTTDFIKAGFAHSSACFVLVVGFVAVLKYVLSFFNL